MGEDGKIRIGVTDLSYIAGLVDGEGCLSIGKYKKNTRRGFAFREEFCISSTDREILDWVQNSLGCGKVYLAARASSRRKASYHYRLFSTDLKQLLPLLIPFLKIKKEQAKILFEFIQKKQTGKTLSDEQIDERSRAYHEIKKLNRRGPPKTVGIKAGCFSLFHSGHAQALRFCSERCDHLIVLTNTDSRILKKKGCVPLNLEQRMCILSSIKGVNQVDFFEEETEERWVSEFKLKPPEELEHCKLIVFHDPDVTEPVPCKDVADEIVFVPHLPAGGPKYSVSDMFATIRGDE